jgi:hypothetical protein
MIDNETIEKPSTFEIELKELINKYSMENSSSTPDYMLAEYLMVCLSNLNIIVNRRDEWYKGRKNGWTKSFLKTAKSIGKLLKEGKRQ